MRFRGEEEISDVEKAKKPLNKEDVSFIAEGYGLNKELSMEKNKKEITLLDIAETLERGFSVMATKEDLKNVEARLEAQIDHLDASVGTLQKDMEDVKKDMEEVKGNMVYREEFTDVKDRVKYVEKKLGIESGV